MFSTNHHIYFLIKTYPAIFCGHRVKKRSFPSWSSDAFFCWSRHTVFEIIFYLLVSTIFCNDPSNMVLKLDKNMQQRLNVKNNPKFHIVHYNLYRKKVLSAPISIICERLIILTNRSICWIHFLLSAALLLQLWFIAPLLRLRLGQNNVTNILNQISKGIIYSFALISCQSSTEKMFVQS